MKHLFVGKFGFNTRASELQQLFSKYGIVDRIEMKAGSQSRYAFVYFEDERDAERAIRWLHDTPFGDEKRRLIVEWAKGKPRSESLKPTKTLFVFNLDPNRTKELDIKIHFEPHGNVLNVRIKGSYSFVEFATQEDATKALKATKGSKILDRRIGIDYSNSEISNKGSNHYGGIRRRAMNNDRLSPEYSRYRYKGQTTYERRRRSPDYSRRSRTRSPASGLVMVDTKNRSRSPVS